MTWWSFVDLISFDWMMTGSLAQSETEDDGVVPQPAPRSRPRSRISLTPSPSSSALVWDHEVLVGKEVHTHTLSLFLSLFLSLMIIIWWWWRWWLSWIADVIEILAVVIGGLGGGRAVLRDSLRLLRDSPRFGLFIDFNRMKLGFINFWRLELISGMEEGGRRRRRRRRECITRMWEHICARITCQPRPGSFPIFSGHWRCFSVVFMLSNDSDVSALCFHSLSLSFFLSFCLCLSQASPASEKNPKWIPVKPSGKNPHWIGRILVMSWFQKLNQMFQQESAERILPHRHGGRGGGVWQ